ncbi:DUF2946 domain-containing protein [Klebsiella sp. WOUb02]|uniref:DUF2946 domain-containing protein n=1 Tax=Klebsiella sp. WOUb02 TaxID=3161071 RepID=UPI003CF10BA5
MAGNIYRQSAHQWRAAWLALFSILLIVVAPLISISLQKDPMGAMPGMHHAMMMAETPHAMEMPHGMKMSHSAPPASTSTSTPAHTVPADHAEACGYCVLLAHVPGLLLALALLITFILRRLRIFTARPVQKHWHYFPWLYPDTRAPPRRSAVSC